MHTTTCNWNPSQKEKNWLFKTSAHQVNPFFLLPSIIAEKSGFSSISAMLSFFADQQEVPACCNHGCKLSDGMTRCIHGCSSIFPAAD